ncbi:MAG: alpha-L-fucosidase [Bacteroidetes bacterium]|nr:alpha-L-fucosidase [Bacteroidota bacterium]
MNELWGEQVANLTAQNAERGQLFSDGNYAMFIHWGLYSNISNQWKGRTYYGIGEWIMNKNMAGIPVDEYKATAKDFFPVNFDAGEIARLAKDAGMKYIIITSKHHDGFAMYHSKINKFNIVDATPFSRDPMKELAQACKEVGIGFGFYYSHNQDWTFPGGNGGPKTDAEGNQKNFDDYFRNKCLPQVKEITTEYGDITLVWFDTPGNMEKKYVEELVEVVRRNQPEALVSGRAGHGLGDYKSLGDMEVPIKNEDGLWETVDVTNDSWGFANYDENWKSPKEILSRLISTVARGGTYMLNVGPKPDGTIPDRAAQSLRSAGEWIKKYQKVVYGTEASPWKHILPWGDVTVKKNKLFLAVYQWPTSGLLYLPGLKTEILEAKLLNGKNSDPITFSRLGSWLYFNLPYKAPEKWISVIEVTLKDKPEVDPIHAIDPEIGTNITADFAEVENCEKNRKSWMEKFGEWKHVLHINRWKENAKATWEVEVMKPGDYKVDLTYSGNGRLVWSVETDEGVKIKNQQNSSHIYSTFPIGFINFKTIGKHTVSISLKEGDFEKANLTAIKLTPMEY